tara:strand:+ start:41595 stop:42167 length:573 start_codon:yes stop_codon:yes gene_type:complete
MFINEINWLLKAINIQGMSNYKSFETERLVIRPMVVTDATFFLKLVNSPKWIQYIGDRNVHSLKDAQDYIQIKMIPQLERLGFGNNCVVRKQDGVIIGSCGLYDRDGLEGIDIGYAFLPEFEGAGYAFESVSKLKEMAFDEFSISVLNAITLPENEASKKLLIKLGFEFQKMVQIPNDPEKLMLFSATRN